MATARPDGRGGGGLVAGLLLLLAILPGCAAGTTIDDAAPGARFEAFVLGVAQDGGLPHLGCDAECCASARRTGRVEPPACLGIHDRETGRLVLVEATPGIESQVAMLHELAGGPPRGRAPVDAILLTHAHIGHYVGLAQLGREVTSSRALPVHVTPRFAEYLRTNGPWSQLVALDQVRLVPFAPGGAAFEPIEGLRVEALPVPHRDEFSDTVAFRIHGPSRTILFCPDVDRWHAHEGLLERLLEGVDVALLDGTFYDGRELPGRDLSEIPHPAVVDTVDRLGTIAAERPGRVGFIHFNHTNPLLHDAGLRASLRARGFRVAERGERLGL